LDQFPAKGGKTPTLSIGIVIAHHLDPLSDVLQLAHDAERMAKDETRVPGKNGLAITLSKRSGVDRTIVGNFAQLVNRLDEMIRLINEKTISGGTAYEIQELQRALSMDFPIDGIRAEAFRIFKRKQAAGGASISEQKKEQYVKIVKGWLAHLSYNENESRTYSLQDLSHEMIIAKALASESVIEEPKEVQP